MPFKNPKVLKKYQKEWYKRKKEGLPTKTKTNLSPEAVRKNKSLRKKIWNKQNRQTKNQIIKKELGNKCLFCGYGLRLVCHRKDGRTHRKFSDLTVEKLQKEVETGNYVRVCFKCHKAVHWCMERLGLTWDEIKEGFFK